MLVSLIVAITDYASDDIDGMMPGTPARALPFDDIITSEKIYTITIHSVDTDV